MSTMTEQAMTGSDLVGTKEAAELFGIRPQNFLRDWASRPDFPRPIATLAATRVWRRPDLEAYRDQQRGEVRWPARRSLKLSPDAERWLPTIKRRIVRQFRPERIVVFGSQARGDATPDSDIDLLVIVADGRDRGQILRSIRMALVDVMVSKDIFVTTPSHAARYGDVIGTLVEPALREGVTIYARS
jgi:predicted nucleotidyltransferase